MPTQKPSASLALSHPVASLCASLCASLAMALAMTGCTGDADSNYRDVTAEDIQPTATTALQPTGPLSATDVTSQDNSRATSGGLDKLLVNDVEPVVSGDAVATTQLPEPKAPSTGRDPVNPLRPALPGAGGDRVNPLRPALPGNGAGPGSLDPAGPPDPRNAAATTKPAVPREIKLLIKEKTFKVEGPEKAIRVSYDDFDLLKVLNMDPVPDDAPKHMPDWLKQLDGKRIRVRGFMYPTFQDPVEVFVLARDNQICCFGRNPKIYDLVRVVLRDGVTSPYIQNRPFDVVGVFHIASKVEEPKLLYTLDDAIVVDR